MYIEMDGQSAKARFVPCKKNALPVYAIFQRTISFKSCYNIHVYVKESSRNECRSETKITFKAIV